MTNHYVCSYMAIRSCWPYAAVVVIKQLWHTRDRSPIYPMLNQRKANPMTPNPGLWLVERN